VNAQDVAAGAVEPGEDDYFVAWRQARQALANTRFEDKPGRGRALVRLARRGVKVGKSGLDVTDWIEVEPGHLSSLQDHSHHDAVTRTSVTLAATPESLVCRLDNSIHSRVCSSQLNAAQRG
jgi:hypothetical protein